MKGWGGALLRSAAAYDAYADELDKAAVEQEAQGLDIRARASRANAQYWREVAAANRKAAQYKEEERTR